MSDGYAIGAIDRHRPGRPSSPSSPSSRRSWRLTSCCCVTTPMIALVPLLVLNIGFGMEPRIIAVALAVGPDGHDQLRDRFPPHRPRQDRPRPLLRRLHAPDLQQVRFPLALPMIIVGLMVGADLRDADGGRRRDRRRRQLVLATAVVLLLVPSSRWPHSSPASSCWRRSASRSTFLLLVGKRGQAGRGAAARGPRTRRGGEHGR